MKTLRGAAIASMVLTSICLGGAVVAQDRGGYYVSIGGLLVIPRAAELSVPVDDGRAAADIEMISAFGALAAFGYTLPSGLGAELELGYRGNDYGEVSRSGGQTVDGDQFTYSVMANGIFSFGVGGFRPYAGLGLGLAIHEPKFEPIAILHGGNRIPVSQVEDGYTSALAYQVFAGVGYPLSDRAEALLGYRYFASGKADLGNGIEMSYGTHNFEAGVRYRF